MTEELMEMAKQAGYFLYDLTETHQKKTVETDEDDEWAQLEAFAKLVAAKRTENIARYCIWLDNTAGYTDGYDFANAIRVKFQDE